MFTQNNHSNFKTFVARKRYKGLSLNRDNLNIPAGSILSCKGGILFYNNIPVAFVTSQVSLDYFTTNDDECGMERGEIIDDIFSVLVNKPNSSEQETKKR